MTDTQTTPKIDFVRDDKQIFGAPKGARDFRVMIDGEHRATFRSDARYGQRGYTLIDIATNKTIAAHKSFAHTIFQSDFVAVTHKHLDRIPTREEIERAWMISDAENEDRERTAAIASRKAELRREIMRDALTTYLATPRDGVHFVVAKEMLAEYERNE